MNTKLKKIISVSVVMIVLVMSVSTNNIKAEEINEDEKITQNDNSANSSNSEEGITPYYNYIMSNYVNLDITGNIAESTAELVASQHNVKSISMHITLQRKLSGTNNWTNVKSWTERVNEADIYCIKKATVTTRGTYRTVTDTYVYDNNNGCEADTNYSPLCTY